MDIGNNSFLICENCFKSKGIKSYIKQNKIEESGACCICGENGIDISKSNEILQMITNIIKYNYPTYKYFSKEILPYFLPGKTNIKDVLISNNELFVKPLSEKKTIMLIRLLRKNTNIENEKCFDILQEDIDYLNVISYEEHFKYPLKNSEAVLIKKIKADLYIKNHYNIFDGYSNIFNDIKSDLPSVVLKDRKFYRSRIGTNKKKIIIDDFETEIEFPFVRDEIRNVPPMKAKSGRFNRMGCSMMYIACNQKTAIAESDPDVGHICTVSEFICEDEREFLDMRLEAIQKIYVEDKLIIRNICDSLMRTFNEPITRDEKNKYLVTQFFSDIFRGLGYAGIVYDSALTTGYNVVAFYPECIKDSNKQEMILVKKVQYEFEKIEDKRKVYENFSFANEEDEKYQLDK